MPFGHGSKGRGVRSKRGTLHPAGEEPDSALNLIRSALSVPYADRRSADVDNDPQIAGSMHAEVVHMEAAPTSGKGSPRIAVRVTEDQQRALAELAAAQG